MYPFDKLNASLRVLNFPLYYNCKDFEAHRTQYLSSCCSIWIFQCSKGAHSRLCRFQSCNSHPVCIRSNLSCRTKCQHPHHNSHHKRSDDSVDDSTWTLRCCKYLLDRWYRCPPCNSQQDTEPKHVFWKREVKRKNVGYRTTEIVFKLTLIPPRYGKDIRVFVTW